MLVGRRPVISPVPAPEGISVTSTGDLSRLTSGNPVEGSEGSSLVFGFGQGGVSRVRCRAAPGTTWIATCEISLEAPGDLLPCKFGPLILDETGNVTGWWQTHAATFGAGETIHLRVELAAPVGAYWVALGMVGPWIQDGHTTATYRFSHCRLVRANPGYNNLQTR